MLRTLRVFGSVLALALIAACASGAGAPATVAAPADAPPASVSDDATTADGIFTVAQAQRGHDLFLNTCSECHDTADWVEPGFQGRWEGQSVFQLWYYINDRMPYDDPWSLSRQEVTDMIAYILDLNDLPAGDAELATDDDSIDDYWIAWESR